MDAFKAISVTLSLVIGLGVARLLSSNVTLFKSRHRTSFDWIPLAWAACIFLWQIQFWWAIIQLPDLVNEWSIAEFGILLAMTLTLYIAAALILPIEELAKGETLADEFQRDGRWALVFLSLYFVLAIAVNWWLFRDPPYAYPACINLLLIPVPLAFLIRKSRRDRAVLTLAYIALSLWAAWENSPHVYQ